MAQIHHSSTAATVNSNSNASWDQGAFAFFIGEARHTIRKRHWADISRVHISKAFSGRWRPKGKRGQVIEPLHVSMPHEEKSCPGTSLTHPSSKIAQIAELLRIWQFAAVSPATALSQKWWKSQTETSSARPRIYHSVAFEAFTKQWWMCLCSPRTLQTCICVALDLKVLTSMQVIIPEGVMPCWLLFLCCEKHLIGLGARVMKWIRIGALLHFWISIMCFV